MNSELKSKKNKTDRRVRGLEFCIDRLHMVLRVHILYRPMTPMNSKIDPAIGIEFLIKSGLYPEEPYALGLWAKSFAICS